MTSVTEGTERTTQEKMEIIGKFTENSLCKLFGDKNPFSMGLSVDVIYEKCFEVLTFEALLSGDWAHR